MLLVLFGSYKLCSAVAFYLRVYAPTSIALDYFRSRSGLKWALPLRWSSHRCTGARATPSPPPSRTVAPDS